MKIGGSASSTGITFEAENYEARFVMQKDNRYAISTKKLTKVKKKSECLMKIPLVRGMVVMLRLSPQVLPALLVYVLTNFFSSKIREVDSTEVIDNPNSIIFLGVISIFIVIAAIVMLIELVYSIGKIVINVKHVRGYHGAEHKTIYAYKNEMEMTSENVKGCPRTSDCCGTNLVVFYIVLLTLIVPFIKYFNIICIIVFAFVLAYELFKIENGDKMPLLSLFYKFGGWCQEKLFTSEPSNIQIEAAIATLKTLIELEEL